MSPGAGASREGIRELKATTAFWKDEEAFESMEFAVIGSLFALAVIAGMTALRDNLQIWFQNMSTTIGAIPTS